MTEHLEFENSDIPVFKNLPRNLDNVDISISPFSPILWISGVLALGTIAVLEIIMASRYHFNFDRRGEGNIVLILVYLALVGYGVFKSIKYLYQQSRNKLVMWGIKPAEQYVLEVHEESE